MTPDEQQLLDDMRPLLQAWLIKLEIEAAIGPLPRETVEIDRDGLEAWFDWIGRQLKEGNMPSKSEDQRKAMQAAAHGFVAAALERALRDQVGRLFAALMAAPADDVEAMARFLRGLDKALALHNEVTAEVEAQALS
jgi:hypothetical protein